MEKILCIRIKHSRIKIVLLDEQLQQDLISKIIFII